MIDHVDWPVSAEQLLAETQQLTSSGTWCLDTSKQKLYWSENTYALFERDVSQTPSVSEALKYYAENYGRILEEAIANALKKDQPWSVEAKVITETGKEKWVRTCGKPYQASDEKIFLFGSIQDISESHSNIIELEQRTEALHSILDNLIDGVVTINEKGIIQAFSKPAERIFGYKASEVIGLNVKQLMPQPYRREHDQYLKN
jgi:PAS domain-containing protein